jgi:hypothetical protein
VTSGPDSGKHRVPSPRPPLDHLVVLKSTSENRAVRVNLLRGMPDYVVVKSDIDGAGCVEVLVPDCGQFTGGFSPGEIEITVEKLTCALTR